MITSVVLVVVGVSLVAPVNSVDRSNFKTCEQSGFCQRNRALTPGNTPYEALLNTVKIHRTNVTVELLNKKTNVKYHLDLIGLTNNVVRMRITEADPIRPRYEPPIGDALLNIPEESRISVQKRGDRLEIGYQSTKVVLKARPFSLDVVEDGNPVISVNSRGLLKFEQYNNPDKQVEEAPKEDGQAENKEEEGAGEGGENDESATKETEAAEPGIGEETFEGHQDTKPHGSSSVGMDFSFPGFEHVYGIPEHADTLALKSTKNTDPYRLYNLDVFEYELHNPMALYGSVPLMYAHSPQRTVGVFWLNPSETWVDISNNKADKNLFSKVVDLVKGDDEVPQVDTHWFSESGVIDVFFLLGPKPKDVFYQYGKLTGTTPLPPLFSIAYHQCRWNYNDQDDVRGVDANFDVHDIPYDVIWLDIEHTNGKRYFTWDAAKFSHSFDMIKNISAKGRKMVTVIDPHIKKDDGWELYKEARDNKLFVKDKSGNDYEGWCWPGSSFWLDFINPDVCKWYADRFDLEKYQGSSKHLFTWNDMNEPSVFNGPEITMHKDAIHHGGWEHREVHNIFGMYQQRASAEGQVARSGGNERPFVLSRAFFAGSQRHGAIWTGDNMGEWSHLKMSIPMLLSLSLAGITFSGADVGGFFKNPDAELLTRWYQAGAFQPFFRAHAHLDTKRREPWLLPETNMKIIREAIRYRYKLLPYWYTQFYKSEQDGSPVMRPLWVEFPKETSTFATEDEFMIGNALLVHPVTDSGASSVSVQLPGANTLWYDLSYSRTYNGGTTQSIPVTLNTVPVFQKGGTIVPRKERVRRASILGRFDPYTLFICLDKAGNAEGDLYIDDYHTFRYKKKNDFAFRSFTFKNNKLENRNLDKTGNYQTPSWLEKVVIFGVKQTPRKIALSGPSIKTARDLEFNYSAERQVLVIRKPDVNIAGDFSIVLR
ncbi:neutral alpha-glucosidase AB-like isoform X2 [Tubulanus polymorphus]|uniref:neutral alpha-glucosidase AB-like isoform X2 n=1 Tax=Tubulanus polymorphus TaxID=672921 RepID=UPI003DA4BE9F